MENLLFLGVPILKHIRVVNIMVAISGYLPYNQQMLHFILYTKRDKSYLSGQIDCVRFFRIT